MFPNPFSKIEHHTMAVYPLYQLSLFCKDSLMRNMVLKGASSCQNGELRNLFQKWWLKKSSYTGNKFERAALYDDLFFLTALLSSVPFSIRNFSAKNRISHIPHGKCSHCGVNAVKPAVEGPLLPSAFLPCFYCEEVDDLKKKAFSDGLEKDLLQVLDETLTTPTKKKK